MSSPLSTGSRFPLECGRGGGTVAIGWQAWERDGMISGDAIGDRVAFRVKARIVSEIGDELISSDEIALYELIKNAYDAQASFVRISIDTPIGIAEVSAALDVAERDAEPLRNLLLSFVDEARLADILEFDTNKDNWQKALGDRVLAEVCKHSRLVIDDNGEGMTREILLNGFLMLASTERLRRSVPTQRVPLGSKGVGRFSAKRLGRFLQVDTYAKDAAMVEHLRIDWSDYSTSSELFLDEVTNQVWSTAPDSTQKPGTTLTISELNHAWTSTELEQVARERLSTFINPFFPMSGFHILARFNRERVDFAELQREILAFARLRIQGHVDPTASPKMRLVFTPRTGDPGAATVTELVDDAKLSPVGDLSVLGPFQFEMYDFVRDDSGLVRLGRRAELSSFLNVWGGGGPMLFRDGFRVMPYGRPGYDWLGIDRIATQGKAARLRTLALAGFVAVSAAENPGLIDQTNREGLRDTDAFRVLKDVLQVAVRLSNNRMREFWPPEEPTRSTRSAAKEALRSRAVLDELADEVVDISQRLSANGVAQDDGPLTQALADRVVSLRSAAHAYAVISSARGASIPAQSYPTLIELAGLGMAAEQLSHELLAALDRSESVLSRIRRSGNAAESPLLEQLAVNFASLRRIAGFLMPLTQASRRDKGNYDVLNEAKSVGLHHQAIADGLVTFETLDSGERVMARINRGVLLQVFDNLIANSLYWLNAARTGGPAITVRSEGSSRVTFCDNGPGIEPRLSESIFQPFVSTKPQGRGLGLFIARELLELQSCSIDALEPGSDGQIHGFVLDFQRALAR